MKITFFFPSSLKISASSSSNAPEASTTKRIRSAFSAACFALSTPIRSTTSFVHRIPAVSTIFNGIPFKIISSSSVSLVVPAISVTIALFSPRSKFKRDDLPVFGFPNITVLIPSFIRLPFSDVLNIFCNLCCQQTIFPSSFSANPSRLIFSGSSSAASINAISSKICCRKSLISLNILPLSCLTEFSNSILLFA